jgi:DNA-binding HxlR family transcriptional regulator
MVDSAELFDAIAHPVRIKILKILEKQPSSFASLKRQLDFASSGNLDFHLKKLRELVEVREDGLYGLTKAGKKALLSIDAVESWMEMERHRITTFDKMPKAALFLGLMEICTTVGLLIFFFSLVQYAPLEYNFWGFLFFGALLLMGFRSGIGVFFLRRWSWIMALAKSALTMSMSLFLLNYAWNPDAVALSSSVAVWYLAFVPAEIAIVVLALMHPVKEFLGVGKIRLTRLGTFGSLLCISNGLLLVLLESMVHFPMIPSGKVSTVFTSISDTSILCGLLIMVGGVLILAGSTTMGAVISIIFGFFPPLLDSLPQKTYHAYDLIMEIVPSNYGFLIAVAVGSLPIVGALLALASTQKLTLW